MGWGWGRMILGQGAMVGVGKAGGQDRRVFLGLGVGDEMGLGGRGRGEG